MKLVGMKLSDNLPGALAPDKVFTVCGDCTVVSDGVAAGSVDLVLIDPPYGTICNANHSRASADRNPCLWDIPIPAKKLLAICSQVLRPNGRAVIFSAEPLTSELVQAGNHDMKFNYRMIWEKDHPAFTLGCNKNPCAFFEDIVVFTKTSGAAFHDREKKHPLRTYFRQEKMKCPGINFNALLGNTMSSHYFTCGDQFCIPTRAAYEIMQQTGHFNMPFEEVARIDKKFKAEQQETRTRYYKEYNEKYPAVFNLWQGDKIKSNILKYNKPTKTIHPTQKPVELLEDIIKTFTNPGDVVFDFCFGSGSTGVAAIRTGRRFLGIEKDPDFYKAGCERMKGELEK